MFKTWQELLDASAETIKLLGRRLADAVLVTVQDQMHLEVVLAFAAQGYHILCEKPMGTTVEDCLKMEAAVKKAGVIFGMGHGPYGVPSHVSKFSTPFVSSKVFTIQSGHY